jgi:hypothetical protein
VFRVRINGENLINSIDGHDARCGFYKNEYVCANDETEAGELARTRVEQRVQEHPSLRQLDDLRMRIAIESVQSGFTPFSLLRSEGFVFYPVDDLPNR